MWLVRYRTGAFMPTTAGTAQEFSVSGAALGPPRRLPRGYVIDQGTVAGLLLVPELARAGVVRYQLSARHRPGQPFLPERDRGQCR
jgi:hypothetical protein